MTITYDWRIANLKHELSDGYVYIAHWTATATSSEIDPEGSPYSAGSYGSVGFRRPNNLIPYDQLTEELVVSWVKEALGAEDVSQIEAGLSAQIEALKHPKSTSGTPW